MHLVRIVLAGLSGALAASAQASPEAKIDCTKPSTTPEINVCAERDFKRADTQLNAAYKAMLGRVETGTDFDAQTQAGLRAAIGDAQRKWVAFRDADCTEAIGREWTGGTGQGAAIYTCLTEKTLARTKELEARPH